MEPYRYGGEENPTGIDGNVGYYRDIFIFQGKTTAEPPLHVGEGIIAGIPSNVGYDRAMVIF